MKEEIRTVTDELFKTENLGNNCTTYNDGVDTFLRGECSQNYVWYSGKLWRAVLKNNSSGAVKLVTDNAITAIPYNAASSSSVFENSYVDQWLNQEFLPTLHDASEYLVTNSIWDTTSNTSKNPARPTGTTTIKRTVGLLNAYEYYRTYRDSGVSTLKVYLTNGGAWWLINPYSTDVAIVGTSGSMSYSVATNSYDVRPSVNLKATIQIDSGNGTRSNPYTLKGDKKELIGGTTLLNTRYSGEYVSFNNELYRIVSTENGLTKIIAVNKPSSLSSNAFDNSSSVNFSNSSIKTNLEAYYQSLDSNSKNMIQPNTIWYLGTVGRGTSYKASICASVNVTTSISACTKTSATTTANIGLPRVGELFTSHITRETKANFWTLTPYDTSKVQYASTNVNSLAGGTPTATIGARPSMYLKSTVKIASDNTGNGTYEKPYKLSL